jgi:hypothetical protein
MEHKKKVYHNSVKIEALKMQFLQSINNHMVEFKNQYYLNVEMQHLLNQRGKELKN